MKRMIWILAAGVVVFSQTGCQTTGWEQQRQQDTRIASEISALRVSMERMEHRLADLVREQDVLGQDVQSLRSDLQQQTRRSDAELSALSTRIDAQARSQSAMRKELTDDLSARMASIMQAQARSAAAARSATTRSRAEVGYEHEVGAGETLSEIARAYGVSSQDIMQANQLRDPNLLRVGQKLFIPER